MLRMDGFDVVVAHSPAEAVSLYASTPSAQYIAGGTDLVPNLKHRILKPTRLVALAGALPRGLRREDTALGPALVLGAGTSLAELADLSELPPLAQAAGLVAGPQLRRMGTLGGNILLDTRCLFYNQTEFWRQALGHCLKAEGTWCHVVGGPKTCVATQSSDTVPVLLALDATLRLLGPQGARELRLRDLYRFNGMDHLSLQAGELLTEVVVPAPGPRFRGSYQKLRTRDAIDFPQLGVAITGDFDGPVASRLDIVIGAINPQPKPVAGLEPFLGRPLDEPTCREVGELVWKRTRPQASVHGDTEWRRRMAAVFVRRGLLELAART